MGTTKPPKFLVCVDQHDESISALKFACLRGVTRGAIIDIIHVIAPTDFQTLGVIADRMMEERRQEGEAILRKHADTAKTLYGLDVSLILRQGSSGDEIMRALEELGDVSVLVIGTANHTRGRGKLAAWLAQQLGQKLFIPLLMVPGNLTDEQLQSLM